MKMHGKPALRHRAYVEPFSIKMGFARNVADQDTIGVEFKRASDGATQLLILSKHEAKAIVDNLNDLIAQMD